MSDLILSNNLHDVIKLLCSAYSEIKGIHPDWVTYDHTGQKSANICEYSGDRSNKDILFTALILSSQPNESPVMVGLRGLKIDKVVLDQIAKKINEDKPLDGRFKIIPV